MIKFSLKNSLGYINVIPNIILVYSISKNNFFGVHKMISLVFSFHKNSYKFTLSMIIGETPILTYILYTLNVIVYYMLHQKSHASVWIPRKNILYYDIEVNKTLLYPLFAITIEKLKTNTWVIHYSLFKNLEAIFKSILHIMYVCRYLLVNW